MTSYVGFDALDHHDARPTGARPRAVLELGAHLTRSRPCTRPAALPAQHTEAFPARTSILTQLLGSVPTGTHRNRLEQLIHQFRHSTRHFRSCNSSGTYTDPRRSRITVAEWAARWLATKVDLKATTRRGYEGMLRTHVLPRWGQAKLDDIMHEQIAAWIAELRSAGRAASTVRQAHRVLSLVLALAVRDGRLARNPASGVPLPTPAKGKQVFLTHAQLESLADAAGHDRIVGSTALLADVDQCREVLVGPVFSLACGEVGLVGYW